VAACVSGWQNTSILGAHPLTPATLQSASLHQLIESESVTSNFNVIALK
jgi:hypothetical protein